MSSSIDVVLVYAGVFISAVLVYSRLHSSKYPAPLPPGPRPIPFIGNLHQLPKVDNFRTLAEWGNIYGPVVYFQMLGRPFVLLSTLKVASDLLVKRSGIYNSRPRMVMAELVGRVRTSIFFLPYGHTLRERRRLVNSWMNKQAVCAAYPVQEVYTYKLLESLLDNPENFSEHLKTLVASVILKLTYGIDCASAGDPHIALADRLAYITTQATHGRWVCDSFPSSGVAYLPSWFPGAGFKRWAIQARKTTIELVHTPFELVRTLVLNGTAAPSWMANEIVDEEGHVKTAEEALYLVAAGGAMYTGGTGTLVAALRTFFLMMATHPEVQCKAQTEIDNVVGHDRLPKIDDRDSLPYLKHIIAEILRFNPPAPLLPRSLEEDDLYEGYVIPKGAWVLVNFWALLHDPATYHNPEEFRPERFEGTNDRPAEPDCTGLPFGFIRRKCPGYHLAMSSLFYSIALVLSVFNIEPVKDAEGKPQVPPLIFDCGHLREPRAFQCDIIPRSAEKADLVRGVVAAANNH